MGFNPELDMCNPNKERTLGQKIQYHASWALVSIIVIVASPYFIAKWAIDSCV